jgi:hypothetical protein
VLLAFQLARVKTPWMDEGWVTYPAVSLAHTGHTGISGLEPSGSWLSAELTGANRYCYWNLPASLLVQGIWYKVFGFSILTMRSLGIAFGLVGILSWFIIVSKLSASSVAGSLAAVFLAVDYTYLWTAADGRMDMMCAALGWAGIASYLALRETRWNAALWLSNSLMAISVSTHPNAVMPLLSFFILLLYFDRRRLSWRSLVFLTPYLAIANLWGAYILQRPDYFLAQFHANTAARGGVRWGGLAHPWQALVNEVAVRYLFHFSKESMWGGQNPAYAQPIPLCYCLGFLAAWIYPTVRRTRGLLLLLLLATGHLVFMVLFVGLKSPCYTVYILPFYAATWALVTWKFHVRHSLLAPLSVVLGVFLIGCQVGVEVYKIRQDAYHTEYLPVVRFVESNLEKRGGTVTAHAYFGFNLGFDSLRDDIRLGFYSPIRPRLVIEDIWYDEWWNTMFLSEEPSLYRYVHEVIETEYEPVFENRRFRVFERKEGVW